MKLKGYFRTALFALVAFVLLWYLMDIRAIDLVENPSIALGFSLLLIAILFNGKIATDLRESRNNNLTEAEKNASNDWYKNLIKILTKTKPIEQEEDILLEHTYDGIRELDNDLPPCLLYTSPSPRD